MQECEAQLKEEPESANAREFLEDARAQLYCATHPVNVPHEFTANEIGALNRFREWNCEHTPHLLAIAEDYSSPELSHVSEEMMPWGYMVFILMTKVPGKRVDYHEYWALSHAERDDIRAAFRDALE